MTTMNHDRASRSPITHSVIRHQDDGIRNRYRRSVTKRDDSLMLGASQLPVRENMMQSVGGMMISRFVYKKLCSRT